ncbi:MAG: preprotein translocase subunit SecE [Cellvibrionaceae bacterium]|jgi:preprotein translocase subunit SecE
MLVMALVAFLVLSNVNILRFQVSAKTAKAAKSDGQENYPLNWMRWLIVMALVAGGIFVNSFYGDFPLLYRVVGLVVLAAAALFLVVNTRQGAAVWGVIKESRTEIRKVVWPTRQETNQTTLIVVVLTIVMAFILWGLDSLLGWIASLIIG